MKLNPMHNMSDHIRKHDMRIHCELQGRIALSVIFLQSMFAHPASRLPGFGLEACGEHSSWRLVLR